MATFGDIVAYQYKADLYCPDCIVRDDVIVSDNPGPDDLGLLTTEEYLDDLAAERGIDRNDEATFDSGDFPKVVLFDHLHDQGQKFYCESCGKELDI